MFRPLHWRIEHLQGATAGVDFVVMGEIRKGFEDAEQVLVSGSSLNLHVACTALRTERPEPRSLVAALWARRYTESTERPDK